MPHDPLPTVAVEARCLVRLVERGASHESVRELIGISAKVEARLRWEAQCIEPRYPEESVRILKVIAWRREVLAEFERLIIQ